VTGYVHKWFICPPYGHPSKYYPSIVHGRESNSQPADHESDALTATSAKLVTTQSLMLMMLVSRIIIFSHFFLRTGAVFVL